MAAQAKYRNVEEFIKQEIREGRLKTGDQIMTEEQLREIFPYSPMTINKALTNLSSAGYLERIPGKGSFVSTPPHKNKKIQSASSFSDDMRSIGLVPGAKLISYSIIHGADNPEIAKTLSLSDDDLMHYFVRLRTGSGNPIAISYTYLDAKTIPALDVSCLETSLYSYFAELDIVPRIKSQRFSAALPTAQQKELLKVENMALLCITSLMSETSDTDRVFEHTTTYYIGDSYSYLFEPSTAQLSIESHGIR